MGQRGPGEAAQVSNICERGDKSRIRYLYRIMQYDFSHTAAFTPKDCLATPTFRDGYSPGILCVSQPSHQ